MIRHNYTLEHVARSLRRYIGCRVSGVFSQEKNSMVFEIAEGEVIRYLQFYTEPNITSLFMRGHFNRAKKNSADLFECIRDETIQKVNVIPGNRIIRITLMHSSIYFFIFGGAASNAFAVSNNGKILESFKDNNDNMGKKFVLPESNLKPFHEFPPETRLSKALAGSDLILGKYYANELLDEIGVDGDRELIEFDRSELDFVYDKAKELTDICLNSKTFYLLEAGRGEMLFSLIPLKGYKQIEKYDDINLALGKIVIGRIKNRNFSSEFKRLSSSVSRQLEKIKKKIALIGNEDDSAERAERYKYWGDLLSSQPEPKRKHGSNISVTGWDGNETNIPLNEQKNLLDNAAYYYKKARSALETIKHRKQMLPALKDKFLELKEINAKLEKAESVKDLELIKKNINPRSIRMEENNNDISSKYRVFDLGEGYTLYVGKSAADNDELTMRFARPNDLWFHARGASGSHCVLRLEKGDRPPKYIIERAASVAAYYSKARNAKYTPVAYTFKKYVRKPKGANQGAVTMAREDVVMVTPKLPGEPK